MPGLLKSPENSPRQNQVNGRGAITIDDLEIIDVRMHSRPENGSPMQIIVKPELYPRIIVRRADGRSRRLG